MNRCHSLNAFKTFFTFSFYCNTTLFRCWLSFSIILFITSIKLSLSRHFNHAHHRSYRTIVYILFSTCGLVPAFLWFHQMNWNLNVPSVYYFLYEITSYLLGSMFYSLRIPERFIPGKCDYILHSHQLFHIMTIVGAVFHYYTINQIALYRKIHQCY
jgi:adiponectin receptor